jgi:quercetin dioxygenase-like cupin family protein
MTTPASSGGIGGERFEAIGKLDQARPVTVVPGVTLWPLVDTQGRAENLLTGVLTIEPAARYPHYTRPFTEVLTLLEGDAAIDAEERRYRLWPLDSAVLPRHVPRRVVNLSTRDPAVFHIALAAGTPLQTWVNARFESQEQPLGSTGREHAEQLCRNNQATPQEFAPRALVQEFSCVEPGGVGLSGEIVRFEPGARLPCHRVDADGSITILEGTATCIVEGRRHDLASRATVFVPRGLCHYIINLTLDPLVMIWVHAGGQAERIVVDDSFCHPERKVNRAPAHP